MYILLFQLRSWHNNIFNFLNIKAFFCAIGQLQFENILDRRDIWECFRVCLYISFTWHVQIHVIRYPSSFRMLNISRIPREYPNTEMLASEMARFNVKKSVGCRMARCRYKTNITRLFPNHDSHPAKRKVKAYI